MVPGPEPLAPELMVIQEADGTAVQLQSGCVVTLTSPVSEPEPCAWLVGFNAYEHGAGFCPMVRTRPAIMTTPVRPTGAGLAST